MIFFLKDGEKFTGATIVFGLYISIYLVFPLVEELIRTLYNYLTNPTKERAVIRRKPPGALLFGEVLMGRLERADFLKYVDNSEVEYIRNHLATQFNLNGTLDRVLKPDVADFQSTGIENRLCFVDVKSNNFENGIVASLTDAAPIFKRMSFQILISDYSDEIVSSYHRSTQICLNDKKYIVFENRRINRGESLYRLMEILDLELAGHGFQERCYLYREHLFFITPEQAEIINGAYKRIEYPEVQDKEIVKMLNVGDVEIPPIKIIGEKC